MYIYTCTCIICVHMCMYTHSTDTPTSSAAKQEQQALRVSVDVQSHSVHVECPTKPVKITNYTCSLHVQSVSCHWYIIIIQSRILHYRGGLLCNGAILHDNYLALLCWLQFQVSSLADELSRKLQFLHVSIDGLADMQILQVQVKVRLVR